MQFQAPSEEQEPVRAEPEPELDSEPESVPASEPASELELEPELGVGSGAGAEEVSTKMPGPPVGWGSGMGVTVPIGVEPEGGELVGAGPELEEELPEPDPPPLEPPLELPEPLPGSQSGVPLQAGWPSGRRFFGSPFLLTTEPGLGKTMSYPSVVMQPLMLATNIWGKLSRLVKPGVSASASRFLDPPSTVMGAQFMYISRLPIRLNQVQARVYFPGEMPSGMAKSKTVSEFPERFPSVLAGHPPSKDLMTIQLESLEGSISVVRLIWQEPPP